MYKTIQGYDVILIENDAWLNKEATMSDVERNKRLAREWYELIGSARYEEAKVYVSDDFVFYPMIDQKLEGVERFIELESSHMDPQPGFRFEIVNIIGEGDYVAVHFIFDGWMPEDNDIFLGLKTTQRHSRHDVMTWLKFNEDGKICAKWAKYNMFFVLKQLDVKEILEVDEKIQAASEQK